MYALIIKKRYITLDRFIQTFLHLNMYVSAEVVKKYLFLNKVPKIPSKKSVCKLLKVRY